MLSSPIPTEAMDKYHSTEEMLSKRHTRVSTRWIIVAVASAVIAGFVIGILIGRFATCPDDKKESPAATSHKESEDSEIRKLIIDSVKSGNIRTNLRFLSRMPHIAGKQQNLDLAKHLTNFWTENGMDHVSLTPYDVLLSYPNMSDLNYVELLDERGSQVYKSELTEAILTQEENKTGVVPPFNAYSAPGDIKGDLVYVNYGRVEDYRRLESSLSMTVAGKIALVRYGKIFRGDKVKLAEAHGAIGIIIYSDPADYTNGNTSQVYPHDWWLPPSGAQRGTVYVGDGDPETPGYPSIDWFVSDLFGNHIVGFPTRRLIYLQFLATAYRERANETEFYMPGIPSHPISYGIAVKLIEQMGGNEVPAEWKGAMNVTYRVGGQFRKPGWNAHIKVSTRNTRATIYNAFGIIKGGLEPDRYVLVGNHRDAWVFGAVDPSTGTAIMMEISRVMGNLVKSGKWRPRRTIIFCSWGAEEYGLVGSTEWVEHYTKALGERGIAYLNVDVAIQGNVSLRAKASPLLNRALFEAARKVPNPNSQELAAGRSSAYDTWVHTFPSSTPGEPRVLLPGSGSDFAPFRDRVGIPVSQFRFTFDPNRQKISSYPLYHSVYETFYLVDNIMDRGFKCHKAIGQVWAEMARNLADSTILPFNISDYATVMKTMVSSLMKDFGMLMRNNGIKTELLSQVVNNFTDEVQAFESSIQDIDHKNPFAVRRVNDQLMQLERAFIDPNGLPGRSLKRHILLAESDVDTYSQSSFPGLVDSMFEIEKALNQTERWEIVKKHYSVILFTIQSAASTLRDVTDFMNKY